MRRSMPDVDPKQQLKTTQTLIAAMIAGIVMFAGVTVFLVQSSKVPVKQGDLENVLLPVLGVLLVGTGIASFAVRTTMAGQARRRHDGGEPLSDQELASKFTQMTIMRGALHEGPSLLGVVTMLLTGSWLGIGGAGIGLLLMLWVFPTRGKFDAFAQDATGRSPGF